MSTSKAFIHVRVLPFTVQRDRLVASLKVVSFKMTLWNLVCHDLGLSEVSSQ